MAEIKEVFISYHEKSAGKLAAEIADKLESAGISCWYAGKDMPIGGDFSVIVPRQISECKVFLLILDKGATESEHVHTELYDAFDRYNKKEIAIFPIQIGDFALTDWARYFLRTIQIKKYPSTDEVDISALVTAVAHKLGREPAEPVKSGECGSDMMWILEKSVLTIFTNPWWHIPGEMGNFYFQEFLLGVNTPWWNDHDKITSIVIDFEVTNIGENAFAYCYNLTSVKISDSVTSIGNNAFRACRSLNSVNIPNSVTNIGYCAFEGCSSLSSVKIPDSVSSIRNGAFMSCPNLKSVSVPANAEIDDNAFDSTTEVIRRPAAR